MNKLCKHIDRQQTILKDGCVTMGLLSKEEVGRLRALAFKLKIADPYSYAIGAIKGSQSVLKGNSPPFPNPRAPRYLDNAVFELFPYMTLFPLDQGEAFFFLNKVLHGSLPNYGMESRRAIRIGLVPKSAQMVGYYLKPQSYLQVVQKQEVDPRVFDNFPNRQLLELYDQNERIPSYKLLENLPY